MPEEAVPDKNISRIFADRRDAGRLLAERLAAYAGQPSLLVLGLPRGGVPVADEVARALSAELDVLIVRKLGLPFYRELAMGAIASGGAKVFNADVLYRSGVTQAQIDAVIAREQTELERRAQLYRGRRPPLAVAGRTLILIDDGLATGATMEAAVKALRSLQPKRLIVAVPVASAEAVARIKPLVDELLVLQQPPNFEAVGQWYRDFRQTSDEEVSALLLRSGASPRKALSDADELSLG